MTEANIYQRLNKVREKVAYLQKDKEVAGRYKAVTHDSVTAALRPQFIEHGIMVVPKVLASEMVNSGSVTSKGSIPIMRYQGRFLITFVNVDKPDDYVSVELDAHALDEGDKAPGKAISYATKYAMLKLFSIETGEDEESRVEQGASEEAIETACKAIREATSKDAASSLYAEAAKAFEGNKAALKKIDAAKDEWIAAYKAKTQKKEGGNGAATH